MQPKSESPGPVYRNRRNNHTEWETRSKFAAGLLSCCHEVDIRMRSHRFLRLDNNKSAASCQQA